MIFSLRVLVAATLVWLALGLGLAAQAAEGDVTGWWLDESKRGGILIEPCGDKMCGTLGWMLHPLDAKGNPKFDTKNPDPKLQNRPICGMKLMGGFTKSGPGEWEDGWIYDSDDGQTYDSKFKLLPDGTLKLRGFVGISLLGQSQVWTRPTETLTPCNPPG
jgi:uncharacterized protein (DUF2147 family)